MADPAPNAGPPLDEIQWRAPPQFDQGIHTNSVLYYFAQSPFYDKTSNNEVVFQQGLNNPNMTPYLATRELFEGRLKAMSGLEFIVAQEPAETNPGAGTGVWVINKQTRRKRQGEEDEIVVHATYFIVGENIYMAPALADIISSRIATISSSISKIFPIAQSVQTWSPALGRVYQTPQSSQAQSTSRSQQGSKEGTPMPGATSTSSTTTTTTTAAQLDSLFEESIMIQERYGGEYMDENPITGKPGEFHLSSTGRKDNLKPFNKTGPGGGGGQPMTLPLVLSTKVGGAVQSPLAAPSNKNNGTTGKETKSPKTPGGSNMSGGMPPKPKRRKSKTATTPTGPTPG
ncbi:MED6 mediator sub complex component-domain-containing protein [Diplogelasinospora grovesii]|uniref:Mediator of RNA polymerase II transcription subunit 6 n=1 Tax=Diplogelasinospora grovesii TaxID=303347 RepID=A0AAN6N6Z8_9PEZI|nr:MED6 mediator sub complex component-domain-containing protein [Diplogelasinospora grovesii]